MGKMKSLLTIAAVLGVLAIAGCTPPTAAYQGGGANGSGTGPAPVNLKSSAGINGGNFAILAESTVTTTGATAIVGDVGLSPAATSYIVGFGTLTAGATYQSSSLVSGKLYAADMIPPTPANMTSAISDMYTAYVDAAGRSLPDFTELYAGNISGRTLPPGLYKWSTGVLFTTDVTLAGTANDTWIFQISQDLTVGPGAHVILAGGALAKNIFWQVGGGVGVILNTTSHVEGTISAAKAINLKTGATVNGRLYAQSAVTMQANTVTKP